LRLRGGPAGHVALGAPWVGEKTVKHGESVVPDRVGDDAAEAGGVTQMVGKGMMCAYITCSGVGRACLSLSSRLRAFNLSAE
jgi:hypothetical protein